VKAAGQDGTQTCMGVHWRIKSQVSAAGASSCTNCSAGSYSNSPGELGARLPDAIASSMGRVVSIASLQYPAFVSADRRVAVMVGSLVGCTEHSN
jgi:hypothetical protein